MNSATAMLSMRPHLLAALVMFLLIGSMVVQPDENVRLLTVVPLLGTYFAFMILYALEVDVLSKAAPSPKRDELRLEMQRVAGDLASINGVPAHERHTHLRAIEFPAQSPKLAEQPAFDYMRDRGY